jgi:DNA polymerase I-like protein with 3'-5' exonuclease and polymerase domains
MAQHHEVPRLLLEYRLLTKLKSTYVDSLPTMINPHTGRIHTSFNQTVAATGRLSSSDPNLQNIPVRTELGREIRKGVLPWCVTVCILRRGSSLLQKNWSWAYGKTGRPWTAPSGNLL